MKRMMILAGLLVAGLLVVNVYAQQSQQPMYGGGMGPGMMNGYGGMMNGRGNGYGGNGYGGMGYGMMHGNGMMNGYGMGPGMMYGQGMMGYTYQLGSAYLFLQNRNYLNLNDAQVAQLNNIQSEELTNTSEIRTNLQLANLQLSNLVTNAQPDMAAIQSQIRQVEKLRGDLAIADVGYAFDARNVLNPQQLSLAVNLAGYGNGAATNQPGVQNGMGGGMMHNQ